MLGGAVLHQAVGRAQHQRHGGLSAEHVVRLGHLVEHLVHGDADEIREMQVDDRLGAGDGRADARADERRLGDRRVKHALGEFVLHAGELAEDAALLGDVLAVDEHTFVGSHLFEHGLASRLAECDDSLTHIGSPHR